MLKEFLYFLVDTLGRSYYIAANGFVLVSSNPTPLGSTPDGWQDKSIAYGRNTRFPGMIRTFTVPLRFVEDGAKILRYLYLTYGIQAVGNLVILKRDITDNTDVYKKYYVGCMDFSQFNYQNRISECNVMEGGLSELIKANESTKYEIPITVPEAISVTFDGIKLLSNVDVLNPANLIFDPDFPDGQADVITSTYAFIGMAVVNTETMYPSVLWGTSIPYYGTEHAEDVPTENWLAQSTKHATVQIKGSLKFVIAGSDGYQLRGFIKQGTNYDTSRVVDLTPFTPPGAQGLVTLDVDTAFDMEPNERLYPFIENFGAGAGKIISFNTENKLNVVYDYRKEATQVLCLRPFYVFDQLIKKITDGKYGASSTLLKGDAHNVVLTSGDAIRGFVKGIPVDYAGPVLKTSLNDFIDSYNVPFNIGLGSRDEAIIERKRFFFTGNTIANLGNVANLQVTPALDHIYNKVTIGYPDQNYEDVNGRSEFNTTHTYTGPVTRIAKELSLQSVYRADGYGIEFTRVNLENRTTTDSGSDDNVFMVVINDALQLSRPTYSSITGVNNDTVINTEISPKKSLFEHGNYMRVGFDKLETGYLTYQSNSSKNPNLSRTLNGVTITENSNVQIARLAPALFLPHLFQFDTEVPINIVDIVEADPYGLINFQWENNDYSGYIYEISQQPTMNPAQTFTLLASAMNDMSKLI